MSHTKPAIPAAINAACQPHLAAMSGMVSGAPTAAMLAPELKIAVASARSRLGNHCAVALIAEGKLPASPKPSANRAPRNPFPELPAPCPPAASDQSAIDTA